MTHAEIAVLRTLKARIAQNAAEAAEFTTTDTGGIEGSTYWRGRRDGFTLAQCMIQDILDGKWQKT